MLDKSRQVMAVYSSLDQEMAAFRAGIGIKCPSHCGQCCFGSTVEATELEMLPLAFELVRTGKAEEWYRRAEAQGFEGRCIFYSSNDGHGQCLHYLFRPLVCRLFGYAGNRDKYGQPRFVTCSVLKKNDPQEVERVLEKVPKGELYPPLMSDWVSRISSVDPAMARESYPINGAFKRAVERVELFVKYS